jgi:hypothetical protein
MVMTKQVSGIRRSRHKTDEVDGKPVTVEYLIEAEPPLVPEKVSLGHTVRVGQGSVDRWKARPAKGKAGEPRDNHTLAVHELIEAYRATGAAIAAVDAPEQKPAKAPKPAKPATETKASGRRARPAKDKPEEPAPEAKPEPKSKGRRRAAKPVTVITDPTPGDQTEATASGGVAPSAATADEPPRLPETELIPVGPEHAAALDVNSPGVAADPQFADEAALEDAVLADPEAAAAVGDPEGWGDGYPEGKHRAPAAANPFEPDPDSPFSNTGFVR